MKIVVALSALLAVTLAAPAKNSAFIKRAKKSAYGAGPGYGASISYGVPCASSGQALAPLALYLAPQAHPHYREDEGMLESETGEAPAARSYGGYGGGVALGAGVGAGAGPGVVGVFPNARVGGCAVPLLLSCAPSVVSGHVVQHEYAQPAASYKEAEQKEAHEHWTNAQRANDAHDDMRQHAAAQPQQHEEKSKKQ